MSTPKKHVLLCMGTRPEVIKMAPVYHALAGSTLEPIVLHTGQHTDIAWPVYEFFGMRPAASLDLPRERPTLGHLNAQLLERIDRVVSVQDTAAMLVHGDTSSALAAALAGVFSGRMVGHVEAGLRSYDGLDPFPEELNRVLIARLARWHFAPTQRAVENLLLESVHPTQVHLVGNTVVDAAQRGLASLDGLDASGVAALVSDDMAAWGAAGRPVLITAHRRENWGAPIRDVAAAIGALAARHDDLDVLWPVHPNPTVRADVEAGLAAVAPAVRARIRLVAPLDYPQMLWALRACWLVATDSGGIQEEAAALDRPVLVLRQRTERPELIEAGGGHLIGAERAGLEAWVDELVDRPEVYDAMRTVKNPYGDGHAGRYIAGVLERELAGDRDGALPRPAPSATPLPPGHDAPSPVNPTPAGYPNTTPRRRRTDRPLPQVVWGATSPSA